MFYADNPDIDYNKTPENSCLTFIPSPEGKAWVLLVGKYKLQSTFDQNIVKNGYSLVHLKESSIIHGARCPEGQ